MCFLEVTGIICSGGMHVIGQWRDFTHYSKRHVSVFMSWHACPSVHPIFQNLTYTTSYNMPGWPHTMLEIDLKVQKDIEEFFGIHPCLWQIRVTHATLGGNDLVTIAPTGLRKSLTYWLPLWYITNGIVIAVTSLKQLGTQFSEKLKEHVTAVSIMASNATNELFEVCSIFNISWNLNISQ